MANQKKYPLKDRGLFPVGIPLLAEQSERKKMLQAKKQLLESDKEISSESLKNIILGIGEKRKMILEIFQEHNDNLESLVGKDFAPGALLHYKTSLDHIRFSTSKSHK